MIVNLHNTHEICNIYVKDVNEIEIKGAEGEYPSTIELCMIGGRYLFIPIDGLHLFFHKDDYKPSKPPIENPTEEKIFKALKINS